MAGPAAAHLLVRRVGGEAAHVAGGGRHDPGQLPEDALRAPEAAHRDVEHPGALGPGAVAGGCRAPRAWWGCPAAARGVRSGRRRGWAGSSSRRVRTPFSVPRRAAARPCRGPREAALPSDVCQDRPEPVARCGGEGSVQVRRGCACPKVPSAEPATIYDVARRAGVSTATVSRVLRGTTSSSAETHARVLAAARDLSYRPDAAPAGWSPTRRREAFGMVLPDLDGPHYSELVLGPGVGVRGAGPARDAAGHPAPHGRGPGRPRPGDPRRRAGHRPGHRPRRGRAVAEPRPGRW